MRKILILSSVFISIPSAVSSQSAPNIYLDCDVIKTYSVPDQRRLGEKISYKIDEANSIIYQFNIDKGIYENACDKDDGKNNFSKMVGSCSINEEQVFFSHIENSIFFYEIKFLRIYRGSGRLRGDLSMYSGPFKDGDLGPIKKPMVRYDLDGSCQRGVDKSVSKKAF